MVKCKIVMIFVLYKDFMYVFTRRSSRRVLMRRRKLMGEQ